MTTDLWYQSPTAMHDLAALLADGALADAMLILQERAKAREVPNGDLTAIALSHATLTGYQKALDDLRRLSQPPKKPDHKARAEALSEWAHAAKNIT